MTFLHILGGVVLTIGLVAGPLNGGGTPPIDTQPDARVLNVGLITNAAGSGANTSITLDRARDTGAAWVREDFAWSEIEPRNDTWRWEVYDRVLIESAKRGLRVLPVLAWTPSWAGSAWNEVPADPAQFAEFTARVVQRYAPGGTLWRAHPELSGFAPEDFEIWNEPYLEEFSAGDVNPRRYATLVKAAVRAGRAANPSASYMLAADHGPSGPRKGFIDGMYAAVPNLNSYFDTVSVHPYSPGASPNDARNGWGFPRLAEIRRKLVRHGARDKPLWVTEIGWSTCPESEDCVTEHQQAAYLERMFELLRTTYSGYVRAAFVYHRTDLASADPADPLAWYGLERRDGSRKPAYEVFRRAAGAA